MEKMFESRKGYQKAGCCDETPDCRLDPPKWEPVERCCPPVSRCEERCPPRTRARDAIMVDRLQVEACFLLSNFKCDEKPLPLVRNWVRMDVRRKGYCKVLTCVPPSKIRSPDGALCFKWNDEFRNLDSGYYEGDIYIDGCLCTTLLFYFPPCQVRVLSVSTEDNDGCSEPCGGCGKDHSLCDCREGLSCCDVKPSYEVEYKPIPNGACDEECGEC